MYRIFLTNFGYYLQDEFKSLEAAKERVKKASFEAMIEYNGEVAYSWSVFGGFRCMWSGEVLP